MRFRSDPDKIAFVTLPASYSVQHPGPFESPVKSPLNELILHRAFAFSA
jgi:hypothetical protein